MTNTGTGAAPAAAAWQVGVGKADVTDRRPGLGLAGFAYPRQRTSGELLLDPDGNEMPLFARAFYVQAADGGDANDRDAGGARPHAGARQLMVVVDIWTCTMAIKAAVLDRLNAASRRRGEPDSFTDASVLIAGTHTHAAPGGYSEYALYNYSMGGWNQQTFDIIVGGIVEAAQAAIASAVPGRVLVNRGDLLRCGGNRAVAALRRNPEFEPDSDPSTWTDTEMLLLRFIADADADASADADADASADADADADASADASADVRDAAGPRDLGVLTWFAIHPTSLGMYNRTISGDNKGWAAMLFERRLRREAPGFVAAFANANPGDVSGNVRVADDGAMVVRRPFGGERPVGVLPLPRPAPAGDLVGDLARMRQLGQQQYEFALALFHATTRELAGTIDARSVFVDMADVAVASDVGADGLSSRTAAAAFGVSFAAGSTEDGIAFASLGPLDVDVRIPEGMDVRRARRGRVELIGAAGAALGLLTVAAARRRKGVGALAAAPPLMAAAALPTGRAAAAAAVARRTLAGELPVPRLGGDAGDAVAGSWVVPPSRSWPRSFVAGQAPKAVMFAAGLAHWRPAGADSDEGVPCPLAPNVVPVQVVLLGGLGIVGVPAEFTSTAGRRLKRTLREALGDGLTDVALAGYANGYSGYVTTSQEYAAQLYEGASTLYGPRTLAAYQQVVRHLAQSLASSSPAPIGHPYCERLSVPVVAGRSGP